MTERAILECLEMLASKQWHRTKDKWWLKIYIATVKKLGGNINNV